MGYDAFISYSHSADGRLAPAVQAGLQRLARPWYRIRALRVFRDESGLSVNPHLWTSIAAALEDSSYFVVLASPEAAASPWVNREIEHFCLHHPAEAILPVLTGGTLVWDPIRGDYDRAASSAIPPAMAGRFTEEPRHLDLRWAHDETQLDLRHSRFREAIADLAAPMHGISKDELEGEDIRRHRRTLRLAWGAGIGLLILTVAAIVSALFAVRYAANARSSQRHAIFEQTAARRNADEARRQSVIALTNEQLAQQQSKLAKRNADQATTNATEASRQRDNATTSAADAKRSAAAATAQATIATRNATEATTQRVRANSNAAEALRQRDQAAANEAQAILQKNIADQNRMKAEQETLRAVGAENTARQNLRIAQARQLAAAGLIQLSTNPDRALLMSVEANRLDSNAQARDSLIRTIQGQPYGLRAYLQFSSTDAIRSIVTTRDGRTAAAVSNSGVVYLVDLPSGRPLPAPPTLQTLGHPVAFSPDGSILMVNDGASVALWNVAQARFLPTRTPIAGATTTTLSNDNQLLAAAAPDGLHLVSLTGTSRAPSAPIALPAGYFSFRLAISPDDRLVALDGNVGCGPNPARSAQDEVRLFDVTSGAAVRLPLPADIGSNPCLGTARGSLDLQFGQQGTTTTLTSVSLGAPDDIVITWDIGTGQRITAVPTLNLNLGSEFPIAVSSDHTIIATSSRQDDMLRLRLLATGAPMGLPFDAHLIACGGCGGNGEAAGTVAFGPAGQVVAAGDFSDRRVRIFDAVTDPPLVATLGPGPLSNQTSPRLVASSADGRVAGFIYRFGGPLSVVDTNTGRARPQLTAPNGTAWALSLSGDGSRAALATGSNPSVVTVWDLTNARVLWQRPTDLTQIFGLALDGTGQRVAATGSGMTGDQFELWDATTGTALIPSSSPTPSISQPVFLPDGTVLIDNITGDTWSFYDVRTGTVTSRPANGHQLVFSRDGSTAASIGTDAFFVLDLPSLNVRTRIPISSSGAHVALSGDGRTLAAIVPTPCSSGACISIGPTPVQMFDTESGQPIGGPFGMPGTDNIVFTNNGRTLVILGLVVQTVDADASSWAARACRVGGRNLTRAEWNDLFGTGTPYEATCPALPPGS